MKTQTSRPGRPRINSSQTPCVSPALHAEAEAVVVAVVCWEGGGLAAILAAILAARLAAVLAARLAAVLAARLAAMLAAILAERAQSSEPRSSQQACER
jgi:hypothetical protein